jgi:hypothetical protein
MGPGTHAATDPDMPAIIIPGPDGQDPQTGQSF